MKRLLVFSSIVVLAGLVPVAHAGPGEEDVLDMVDGVLP